VLISVNVACKNGAATRAPLAFVLRLVKVRDARRRRFLPGVQGACETMPAPRSINARYKEVWDESQGYYDI
jgi:hypothetical protein